MKDKPDIDAIENDFKEQESWVADNKRFQSMALDLIAYIKTLETGQLIEGEALVEKYDRTFTLEIGTNLSWIIVGVLVGWYFGSLV